MTPGTQTDSIPTHRHSSDVGSLGGCLHHHGWEDADFDLKWLKSLPGIPVLIPGSPADGSADALRVRHPTGLTIPEGFPNPPRAPLTNGHRPSTF